MLRWSNKLSDFECIRTELAELNKLELRRICLIWINKKELDGDCFSEGIICEKTLRIYADLLRETPSTNAEGEIGFTFFLSFF